MKLAVRIGWDALFIMNETQLAQLMPLVEKLTFVEEKYVEGHGMVYLHRELKPDVKVLGKDSVVMTPEAYADFLEERNNHDV